MGRKPKYSFNVKLKTVLNIIDGNESISNAACRLKLNKNSVIRWLRKYEDKGESALITSNVNSSYSSELKVSAIKDYLDGLGSLADVVSKYNISSDSILLSWINEYNSHIEIKPYKSYESKGIYMKDNNKYTVKQKLEIAKECIDTNLNYAVIASKYNTSYTNVYSWTRKYIKGGENALADNRGRKKPDEELSEIDLLKRDNARLKRENELKELEIKILKKVEEKERSVLLSRRKTK